jgi:hypothetical protein
MSDCKHCWETPCACGHKHKHYSTEKKIALASVILGVSTKDLADALKKLETNQPALQNPIG